MKRRRRELPAESGAPILWALVMVGLYLLAAGVVGLLWWLL